MVRHKRNGAPQAGRRKGDGRRAGACRCRSLFPRRPSPPVPSGAPPPFRCERSEQRNPLHSRQDLSRCERSERRNPLHPWQDLAVTNAVEPSHCGGSTTMTPHCGGSTVADILTHLAPRKSPTSRQGRKPCRTMRHTTETSRRDDTLSVIPAGHGCDGMQQ